VGRSSAEDIAASPWDSINVPTLVGYFSKIRVAPRYTRCVPRDESVGEMIVEDRTTAVNNNWRHA
jgi:hypothetical protein